MRRIRECQDGLFERELTHRVIGTFYDVYNALGYGFLESVYRTALAIELTRRGLHVATEVPAEVRYDGQVVGVFRADVLVESRLVIELKATKSLSAADEMQVLNYLRATDLELGLLFHFGPRPAFRRFVATRRVKQGGDLRPFASSVSSASAKSAASAASAASTRSAPDARHLTSARPASSGRHPPPQSAAYPTP